MNNSRITINNYEDRIRVIIITIIIIVFVVSDIIINIINLH